MNCGLMRVRERVFKLLIITRYFDTRGNELHSKPKCSGKFVDKRTILK